METPTPFLTFKVRKEKMGDRITALQQLASPFGKTDTASVLHEAIEYIKFLHDQVNVLSTPSNGAPVPRLQNYDKSKKKEAKQDLKSRGLCLVPISSTFPVADENTTDFWIPTFGGTVRDYTMTLQYSSNSSNSLPSNDVKLCHCKRRMNVTTSWNAENPGRRFLSCSGYTFGQKCDYFKWIDPPLCARSKQIIPGLLNKCNDMEREMKMLKFKMKCVMMALSWCFCFLLIAWVISHVVV